jgi:sialate O-acetylesterase
MASRATRVLSVVLHVLLLAAGCACAEEQLQRGEDRRFQPADTTHLVTGKDARGRPRKDMKVLVLSSPMVPEPIHFRYAWGRSPMGNIQAHHNTDVPLATQRSDDWKMIEVPVIGESVDRGTRNEVRKALRLEDMRRRLFDAQTLIESSRDQFEKDMESWKQKWEQ